MSSAGGDGTINEAAEGMIAAGAGVPLAILPAGTANVLATEMKLGSNLETVARRLGELRPRRISVGHVACGEDRVSRHFLLMAGVGLDAHVVYKVNAALKAKTGKFAYWVAGWSLLGRRLPEFEVEIDGQRAASAPSRFLPKSATTAAISKSRAPSPCSTTNSKSSSSKAQPPPATSNTSLAWPSTVSPA